MRPIDQTCCELRLSGYHDVATYFCTGLAAIPRSSTLMEEIGRIWNVRSIVDCTGIMVLVLPRLAPIGHG